MRLKHIWTVRYMPMAERIGRTIDWSALATATHLPKRIRYWTTVTEIAKATKDSQAATVANISVDYVLNHLEGGPKD